MKAPVFDSLLGRPVVAPDRPAPELLQALPRLPVNEVSPEGVAGIAFVGEDRWRLWELAWRDQHGRPKTASARLLVPADSAQLIESKSLKLYLHSLSGQCFDSPEELRQMILIDLVNCLGCVLRLEFFTPGGVQALPGERLDDLPPPPDSSPARSPAAQAPAEQLEFCFDAFRSNCPVTGQPDWASVLIRCSGAAIDRFALLDYLRAYAARRSFHEACVERIFVDLSVRYAPRTLSVAAYFLRRGGIDISPWRASPGCEPPPDLRAPRQ